MILSNGHCYEGPYSLQIATNKFEKKIFSTKLFVIKYF